MGQAFISGGMQCKEGITDLTVDTEKEPRVE